DVIEMTKMCLVCSMGISSELLSRPFPWASRATGSSHSQRCFIDCLLGSFSRSFSRPFSSVFKLSIQFLASIEKDCPGVGATTFMVAGVAGLWVVAAPAVTEGVPTAVPAPAALTLYVARTVHG